MIEENKEVENTLTIIHEENLLSKIWFNPTETLKYILTKNPEKYVTILLVLGGIVRAISRASNKNMGDRMSTVSVLGITIIMGGLLGWISYYIYAWGMSVTGEWIGGKSEPSKFRTIIAWALIPSICSLILLIPEVIIFGDDLFKSEPLNESLFNNISWIVFGFIEVALGVWTMIILIKGTSLIQGFGIGKSILNMFLPGLAIIIPIVIVVLLFSLFK